MSGKHSSSEEASQPTDKVLIQPVHNVDDDDDASCMLQDKQKDQHEEVIEPQFSETKKERRARHISHYVAYITTFIMTVGFSIVLTGVWPYLQELDPGISKKTLGWVISANPLGQMIAAPLLGLWGNKAKSNRGAFYLTVLTFIIGNGLYAVLHAFGSAAVAVMIFSRFLVGVSSANIAIVRSYIAASTMLNERTTAVALASAAQGLGFIFGPAIQTALAVAFSQETIDPTNNSTTSFGEEARMEVEEGYGVKWNMYTATGWIGVVLGIINFFLFLPCVFQEHPISQRETKQEITSTKKRYTLKMPKPDYIALVIVLLSFFIYLMVYVLLETLLVPLCIDMYAWTNEMAVTVVGIGLSIAGAISILSFLLASFLSKHFDERKVLIFCGVIPITLSMLIHFPMGSNYPKIKNCTIPDHPTTVPPPQLVSLQMNLTNGEINFPTLVSEDILNDNEINNGVEEVVTASSKLGNISKATNKLATDVMLRRRRRHVIMESSCNDLGCPPEQEWCFYTPIIEQSQLAVATSIAILGYPLAFTICSSLFSKIIGPKPQGIWMGILTSTGSMSRIIGPIFVTYLYTALGPRWTFGILLFIMVFILIINIAFFKRLVPMKIKRIFHNQK